jgi:hypothetical protein
MGSSGTGNFGDYKQTGGQSGTRCDASIDADLEDVATMPYFVGARAVPTPGTAVRVKADVLNKRLVVEEVRTAQVIGNLPTTYNYLLLCIGKGYQYEGTISASGLRPVPSIDVHLDSV